MPLHQHFIFNLSKKDYPDRPGLKQFLFAMSLFFFFFWERQLTIVDF